MFLEQDVCTKQRVFKVVKLANSNLTICLRTVRNTDALLLSQYFQDNRDHLQPWEPKRDSVFFSVNGWAQKLIKLNELHRMGLGYYCLILNHHTQEVLGTLSFSQLSRFPLHACNVGYSLDKQAQGQGIMRSALHLACDYMFDQHNMHRITANYMPENKKSEGVLKALGFVEEGYAKAYLLINGRWEDHKLMALINPNWQA
ncbi:ribosomal-protein-alanine acetyltransferase [Vibrio sp. 10N.286.49.B3]|uniref:ribosomal protein S5-alanine N-acetyltransferase n=1 Tax=Vibrio sp. 10N.286.49.B3 TaxID=1880855 RepID=UPI000C82C27A|nr:ribosomal protein S5-alanine N-acetyltransferase [Vibrio sp. 10N.286.49.B3]PMH46881.1 ribosomal-protein-alanine acetyltransferase [Vibrio sp. 10N.286.49.B3]